MDKKICVVLPTKNESSTIEKVIKDIVNKFSDFNLNEPNIIITDDSKDGTRAIAKKNGAHIVNGGGKGLGYAMYQGLKSALKFSPDYIISCDADGQIDFNEIPQFLKPLDLDQADLVIGSRFLKSGFVMYKYRWRNRFGVFILSKILSLFTNQKITDSHGGMRAMRACVIEELEMLGTHTYVQETIIDAHEKGFRILEIPSIWKKRHSGTSKVVSSIPTYIFNTLPILFIRSKRHIKWLYSIGIMLNLIALCYFFFISWQSSFEFKQMFTRLPSFVLIALFILAGIQFFFFGFLLQIVKEIKYSVDRYIHKK